MADNRLVIEVVVDEDGKASVKLGDLERDVHRFAGATDKAGQSGLKLRDVFTGNLLSDFFQRGVSAAVQFGAQAVQAAAAASDANRQLEFSATQAGLSYAKAATLAEDFGKRVGASNTEAARTFSDIVRLAERAGKVGEVDTLTRQFADLAAARGIRGAELQSLIGTILSGQDEGLNRLGADDPGKLNAAYAASIGKKPEELNQQEKAAAAVVAVQKLANDAFGQSDARLKSTAGRLDTAAASYENLKTQIGDTITSSIEFRDWIDIVSDSLEGLRTSHRSAREEMAQGLTPAQIARRERESEVSQTWNTIRGGAAAVTGIPWLISGAFGAGTERGADEFNQRLQGYLQAVLNPGQRTEEARTEELTQQLQDDLQQSMSAGINQLKTFLDRQAGAAASAQRSQLLGEFNREYKAATGEENLNRRIEQLEKAKVLAKEALNPADFEKASEKIDDALERTRKEIEKTVITARDAARDFLRESLVQADRDNPFTSLFIRARDEVEKTRQAYLIFGEDFANTMAQVKKSSIDAEMNVARLQSSLSALKYEQEARRLELGFVGLTGPQERDLAVIDARLTGIEKDVDLARKRRFLENPYRGFDRIDAERQNQETLNQILALDVSGAGRAGREAQAQAVLNLLSQFDPRQVATSADPFFRDLRQAGISAYQVQRDALKANVEDEIQRRRIGNLIQDDAREALEVVRQSGASEADKVKEYLRLTGELSEKELTPDLRQGRIDALHAAQQIENAKEATAERRAEKLEAFIDTFNAALKGQGIKVDAPPSNVQVNVGDGLSIDKAFLGAAPRSEDALVGVTPGVRTIGSDF
ncbi:MAG: hypothetical protein ABW208_07225 [Pyrinomonadaceae bacterium]